MVDRYTKVVLTIIAVGLWVQVGLHLNPVGSAAAEFGYRAEAKLGEIAENTSWAAHYLKQMSKN